MAEEQKQQFATEGYQILGGDFTLQQPLLFYQIHGRPAFSYGDVYVQQNQTVLCDGKAMLWMDGSLAVDTECYGGCPAACCRSLSGESCCMNEYSATMRPAKLTVGFDTPGDMLAFGVTHSHGWVVTKGAFVAGTNNLKVGAKFAGCGACCCADEGPFLSTIEIDKDKGGEAGVFLAGSYGMLERHDIPEGKKLLIAAGTFFATHATRDLSITVVGGLLNCCFGAGWKSIVMEFSGPCTVYTQSRNPEDLKRMQMAGQQQEQGKDDGGDGGDGGDMGDGGGD